MRTHRFWCREDCRSDKTRSALLRCGLSGHDVTPDHRGIRLPWDRNCALAFVNLPRQFDTDNDVPRIVERLESQHRAQAPLHPTVVLLHNVVPVWTATNSHRIRAPEVELPVHSHTPQRAMARLVPIQGDARWLAMMLQCLAKKGFRRYDATCSTPLNKRFINPPAPTYLPLESAPTLFAGFGIANDPTQDRVERNLYTPLT